MGRRLTILMLVPVLLAGGCADDGQAPRPRDGGDTEQSAVDYKRPPRLELLVGGQELAAWQGSYCWQSKEGGGACVDTVGPETTDLPDVGSPESVEFGFPVPETTFTGTFVPRGVGSCARTYDAPITDLGDGRFRVDPAGPAGRYRVDIWGRAPQGEAPGSFLWTTPVDGELGDPSASISIVWAPHGVVEGQGFQMAIEDLPRSPTSASATITATAANGESVTFDAGKPRFGCRAEGYVFFGERGDALSQDVAALGPAPFEYSVALELDGASYEATATWPDDHVDDPNDDNPAPVPLVFNPPLPASE